jgi:hypothetical protein
MTGIEMISAISLIEIRGIDKIIERAAVRV